MAVGKTPAWDAAGDLLAWQATDWLGSAEELREGMGGKGTGTKFLISKFLITKFLITKFLITTFLSNKVSK